MENEIFITEIEPSRSAFEALQTQLGGDVTRGAGQYVNSATATAWFFWCAAVRAVKGA